MLEYIRPTPSRRRKVVENPQIAGEPKTVLYVRISKKELHSSNQKQEFKKIYPDITPEVYEEVVQGDKTKPCLNWLLANLPPKSVIYVAAIDRLSRNLFELQTIGQLAIMREINIISMREGDISIMNPIVLACFGWVAEMEKKNLSERVKAGIARVKKERKLGPKEWGVNITKAKAKREGTVYVKPPGRPVRKEFIEALPLIKSLRKKQFTLKEIAAQCTMRYKVNFTEPNISNLLRHGHG
jgi:DNA invertase Pin-like site-specific DNA recombinase